MVEKRIRQVVAEVFGVDPSSLHDESGPDTLATWDSASHINLILAVEAEFGVTLSPEEAMDMLSVGLIRTILSEKGVA